MRARMPQEGKWKRIEEAEKKLKSGKEVNDESKPKKRKHKHHHHDKEEKKAKKE